MNEVLTAAFLIPLFTAGVRMSVPLILGSVGEVVAEKTGVMNIGLEGQMLIAALSSFIVAYFTGSLALGILFGGISGMLGALLIAFWGVSRKQDQSVVGIMFNIFALGFTNFLYRAIFGVSTDQGTGRHPADHPHSGPFPDSLAGRDSLSAEYPGLFGAHYGICCAVYHAAHQVRSAD